MIGLRELRAAEEPEELDGSHLATLLADLAHLHDGEKDTADHYRGADDLGDIGEV